MKTLRELVDDMASICGNATNQWLVERALVFDPPEPSKPYRTRVVGPQQKGATSMNVCAWAATLDRSVELARKEFMAAAYNYVETTLGSLQEVEAHKTRLTAMHQQLVSEGV